MSELDQRRYRLMLQELEWLEHGDFSSNAVGNLMGLLKMIEASDPSWECAFEEGLGYLDASAAVAIGEAERRGAASVTFDTETIGRMRDMTTRLKQMVLAKIEAPADDSAAGT